MALRRNFYMLSSVGVVKLATIVLGITVLIIGLRSHFESAWTKYDFHKLCNLEHHMWNSPCPDIAMERFYVAMITICLLSSALGLILLTWVFDPYNILIWMLDIGYHALSSVLLFIAAILHIVSAIKIGQHPIIIGDDFSSLPPHTMKIKDTEVFLSTQKIIAGGLTIIESFLFIICTWSIRRARSRMLLLQSSDPTDPS